MKRKLLSMLLIMTMCFASCSNSNNETISSTESNQMVNVNTDDGLEYDEATNTWFTNNEEMSRLVDVMQRECSKSADIQGAYMLATDDEIIFIGGINSIDVDGNKVDAYTTYEIGSLTKAFTATAVLQLCEQGKITLDDTLDKYFPEYEYGKDITLYQLLHMQSGLRTDFVTDDFFIDENGNRDIEVFKKYYYDGYTDEEMLELLFSDAPLYAPGTTFSYSNAGYVLLAMIIEQVTGESYGEYVQKNIFDVCGMEHSSSTTVGDVTSIPVNTSDEDPYELVDTLYTQVQNTLRGANDIHSCAADMLSFDRALIGGKLLSEESMAEMFNLDMGYGCGWMQCGRPTYNSYYHGGQTYFYMAYNVYCKSEKYGNVYLIQLHPTLACDNYSNECINNVVTALQ